MKSKYSHIKLIVLLVLLGAGITSCNKDEGFGGSSTIKGRLFLYQYNDDFSLVIDSAPAKEKEVFIVFGNDPDFGDRIRTNFDGYFEFKFLHEGNYTIYYYSEDPNNLQFEQDVAYKQEAQVGKNGTTDLGDLITYETLDYNDGNAVIIGRILQVNYTSNSRPPILYVEDTVKVLEKEVYVTYQNHTFYDDRIRTTHDGTFEFTGLIKGNYMIHVISEDINGSDQDVPVIVDTTLINNTDTINLGDIFIHNL